MKAWTLRDWSKWILTAVGAVIFIASASLWLRHSLTFPRAAVFGVTGLLFVTLGLMGERAREVYKKTAVILLNTLVLLIVLEGAATIVMKFLVYREDSKQVVAALPEEPWTAGYLREFDKGDARHYVPYVIWKNAPFAGQYLNVDDDSNRVTPGVRCEPNSYVVFMFGGSTMWGYGVPDWATIPAYFQAELSKLGDRPVCVRNLGQNGWVSTQSVIELLRHLQSGDAPNLVIFYDGINDTVYAGDAGIAGVHQSQDVVGARLTAKPAGALDILAERSNIYALVVHRALNNSQPRSTAIVNANTLGKAIVKTYLTNYRAVQSLAGEFGFNYAFFWQPNLVYEQKPKTQEEKEILRRLESYKDDFSQIPQLIMTVYPQMQAATVNFDHLFFFGDVFKNDSQWLYTDGVHLRPVGNEKIARGILETLLNNHQLKVTDLRLSSTSK